MGGMGGMGDGMGGMGGAGSMGDGMGGMGGTGDESGGGDHVSSFIQQWGLDDGCAQMLRTASPPLQQTAIATFQLPPDVKNINAFFISFLKKLGTEMRGMQGGGMGYSPY